MFWLGFIGVIIFAIISILLYAAMGWVGVILMLAFILAAALVWVFYRHAYVLLTEMEMGVVFHRNGNFAYFLDSGRHILNPMTHQLVYRMTKGNINTGRFITEGRAREGIPVTVELSVTVQINLFNIREQIAHKLGRALPQHASRMVRGRAEHAIRHMVEQRSVLDLYNQNATRQLETELLNEVQVRTQIYGTKPIRANDVKIFAIHLPNEVENAIKAAYERQLQTRTATEALRHLNEVVRNFDDNTMSKLAELERLRIIENSNPLVYIIESFLKDGHSPGGVGTTRPPFPQPPQRGSGSK